MKPRYLYGGRPAEVKSAEVRGVLIRALKGTLMFRVYHGRDRFTNYEIKHDDLSVTIDKEALRRFTKLVNNHILDHRPEVLGLKKIEGLILRA